MENLEAALQEALAADDMERAAQLARAKRDRLLLDVDAHGSIYRMELEEPTGTSFSAWLPTLKKLTGTSATPGQNTGASCWTCRSRRASPPRLTGRKSPRRNARNRRKWLPLSNLEIIDRLCRMLDDAQQIIREQAQLLAMHGIETSSGDLEEKRTQLLKDIEGSI